MSASFQTRASVYSLAFDHSRQFRHQLTKSEWWLDLIGVSLARLCSTRRAPGRYIYLSRRLYERCTTDEEVAFVVGKSSLETVPIDGFASTSSRTSSVMWSST